MRGLTLSTALLLAASARAQYTTVDLFMYDYQSSLMVASVVAADATATTYSLGCPSSTSTSSCSYYDDDDCDYYDSYEYSDDYCPSAAIVTAAPSFYEGSYDDTYYESAASFHCDFEGKTSATCTCWNSYSDGEESYTTTLDDYYITFSPVIVTAGGDLIGATGGASVETILSTHSYAAATASATATGFSGSAAVTGSTGTASRSIATGSSVATPSGTAGSKNGTSSTSSSTPAQATTNAAASNLPLGASVAGVVAIAFAAIAL